MTSQDLLVSSCKSCQSHLKHFFYIGVIYKCNGNSGWVSSTNLKLKLTLLAKGPLPCLFLLLVQSQSEYSRVINYVQIIWSKDLFSQVDVITKILNSKIFKYFEFIEYFDDVKKMYYSMILIWCYYKSSFLLKY